MVSMMTSFLVNDHTVRSYRLGNKVFKMSKEVHRQCLRYGVTPDEVISYRNRWRSLGVDATYTLAALRALEERKKKGGLS